MNENKYTVLLDGKKVASEVTLEIAVILEKALFEEYYGEPSLKVTIRREG